MLWHDRADYYQAMLKIGLPASISEDFLLDFPKENVELVRLPDNLNHPVEVEFWIPPMFGWLATPMFPYLRGVKVIQCLLAGVDWILPWLPKNILLCDGQGLHNIPVAEWIVGAILGSLWRFPHYRDCQHEQYWDGQVLLKGAHGAVPAPVDPKTSVHSYRILADELHGKKVLIVGYGGIGAELERLLRVFDVEVVRVARTAKPGVSAFGDLASLVPEADVVVLLVPLTDSTRGMMNADMLARMKPGGLLVNAARGPVVDTNALLQQLQAGRIHAVLDVTDPEPLPKGHALWSAPNCFITPHIAGSVAGFSIRGYKFAAEQVRRYMAGEPMLNQVNDAGY
ncbi:MAG TPA: 2-hydroxyacid dehydrogenase [Acidobacteriaceae bacterium]|nr:2-hydroxyacid dehydrogenase [Acidobacteriaceae bacterium]